MRVSNEAQRPVPCGSPAIQERREGLDRSGGAGAPPGLVLKTAGANAVSLQLAKLRMSLPGRLNPAPTRKYTQSVRQPREGR